MELTGEEQALVDQVVAVVRSGESFEIRYPVGDARIEELAGDLCRLIGRIYEGLGIGPVRIRFREEGLLVVVDVDVPRPCQPRRLLGYARSVIPARPR